MKAKGKIKRSQSFTPQLRAKLEREVALLRESGDKVELGPKLLKLGETYLQIGTEAGVSAADTAISCVMESIPLLREAGNKKSLASALRFAATPMFFVKGIEQHALLKEAEEISVEIGDWASVGWTILSRGIHMDPEVYRRAAYYFRKANSNRGLSQFYLRLGMHQRGGAKNSYPFFRAIFHALAAGDRGHAGYACRMTRVFCHRQLTDKELDSLRLETYRWGRFNDKPYLVKSFFSDLSFDQKRRLRSKQKPLRLRLTARNRARPRTMRFHPPGRIRKGGL